MKPLRTAVFPVAGLGTRSFPATKVIPKEMLTVVDKPIIQFAVEEARAAGIESLVFVTSRGKTLMEDHFDQHRELYEMLDRRGKVVELASARAAEIPVGQLTCVRQPEPLGLGHAVWCARNVVRDEPFAVLLPDELFLCEKPLLAQLVEIYNEYGGNIIAVSEVPKDQTARYGIVDPGEDDGRIATVRGLVEKPDPHEAPSNLSIVGRYILQPQVMDVLSRGLVGKGGEVQLTDAMARLIGLQPFHAARFEGHRFDCGGRAGFVAANVAYGLQRPDLADAVRAALAPVLAEDQERQAEAAS
ncbi:MAG: UTP--glucose-1-phosphate uridylyltransferase [Rhodospirillaceae bacterium]|nr:UTP--glucose-1-phosphate uridylyltransferase [Rhodospirillaceae bacterium]MCA8931016.1 UTP--glucose-1-phosphate uridylyltransferase [Rhodospirillaceae bacterium]